jgi:hypothetical protein
MVFSGAFLTMLMTTFDVDSGVDVVMTMMSDDLPYVAGVIRRSPRGWRGGDGERGDNGPSSQVI